MRSKDAGKQSARTSSSQLKLVYVLKCCHLLDLAKGMLLGTVLIFSGCKATADVAFLVDSSGSIGRSRWSLMLDFLKNVTNVFNVGPNGTHIAVIAYSTNAELEFTFNALSGPQITAAAYGKLFDKMRFQRGFTYIDKALIMAYEQVFTPSAGMRPGVPQVSKNTALFAWLLAGFSAFPNVMVFRTDFDTMIVSSTDKEWL